MVNYEEKYGKSALSMEETAHELGVNVTDVELIIENGELSAKKIGNKTIISISAFECYVNKDGLANSSFQSYHAIPSGNVSILDATEEDFAMIKGNGSVYYNNTRNCWNAAFYLEKDGEKKRKIISGQTEDDVRYKLEKIKRGDTDAIPTIKPVRKHLVTEVLDKLMLLKENTRAATEDWYLNLGKKIRALLPNTYIEDMDLAAIQEFVNKLKYKDNGSLYSAKTISETFKLFKMVYDLAYDNEYDLKRVNFKRISLPQGVKSKPQDKCFTDEQITEIYKALKGNKKYTFIVRMLLATGMRIGELLALQYEDIDFENSTIKIDKALTKQKMMQEDGKEKIIRGIGDTKTACSVREIYVPNDILKRIIEWKQYVQSNKKLMSLIQANGTEGYLIVDKYGNLQSYNHLQSNFQAYLKRHGIEFRVTLHMFRHTSATKMYENGFQLKDIQTQLGHSELSTTSDIYVAMTPTAQKKNVKEQINLLNNLL